jgi:hypothetical protein
MPANLRLLGWLGLPRLGGIPEPTRPAQLRLLGWLGLPRFAGAPRPPPPGPTRVDYLTEIQWVSPNGKVVHRVKRRLQPHLRTYARVRR